MRHFFYLSLSVLMFTSCNDNLPEVEQAVQNQSLSENIASIAQVNINNVALQREYLSNQQKSLTLSENEISKLLNTSSNGMEGEVELAKEYNNLGNQHYRNENYEIALFYYLTSLDLKLETGHDSGLALSFRNIALTYQAIGDHRNAALNFWQSYYLYELLDDNSGMAKLLNDLGIVYDLAHDFVDLAEFDVENSYALSYYSQSIALNESFDNLGGVLQTEKNVESFYSTYLDKDMLTTSRTGDVSRDQDDVEDEV